MDSSGVKAPYLMYKGKMNMEKIPAHGFGKSVLSKGRMQKKKNYLQMNRFLVDAESNANISFCSDCRMLYVVMNNLILSTEDEHDEKARRHTHKIPRVYTPKTITGFCSKQRCARPRPLKIALDVFVFFFFE